MSSITCEIVSAEKAIFKGDAAMVIAKGSEGELGIVPQHAPLITRLTPGEVRVITADGEEQHFYVSGGILEVQPNLVSVLADTAIRAADIDEAAAIKAKEQAEKLLKNKNKRHDIATVQGELAQAMAQIQAVTRLKNKHKR